MGQVLEHCLQVPKRRARETPHHYMVTHFIEAVRTEFRKQGVSSMEQNKEKGGQFLVGYADHLFSINSDFHVGDMRDGFDCIGSGAAVALGAMKALEDLPPKQRIERSLEITAYYQADVLEPFRFKSMAFTD